MLVVLAPLAVTVFYLFAIAKDQYATTFGFAIRSENTSMASNLLGGLASLSGASSSSDTEILYEFIQSRALVEEVQQELDIARLYSEPKTDPYFAYHEGGSIEELVGYWQKMVHVSHAASSSSGLLEITVKAFQPEDALNIANAIVASSTEMINRLSSVARDDATRYAREDLDLALDRLKTAREALTRFRSTNRIIDPSASLEGQLGLLNSLEARLADAIIQQNVLLQTAQENDPRVVQLRNQIPVIQRLIEGERRKFGLGSDPSAAPSSDNDAEIDTGSVPDGEDYSKIVGEFERLSVDVEYARQSYIAAQTAMDSAIAEAQRKSRYLATYAPPALPSSPEYPRRMQLSLMTAAFLTLLWSVGVLIYYSLRDRR
ncbi:sugar transporter [Maritimibacter alkaliphilus]|uniref:sugar transporter n=1 Tax=Maritimibacter alkaliphilus TaxID=404236 RepID=UPI0028F74DEC|nr:sugar transporter [Maritimibacter alkaliphilus]